MTSTPIDMLLALQLLVVLFIALHDWIPLGRLNDVRAVQSADPVRKLVMVTVLSTLPFAVGLAASVCYAGRPGLPHWLLWFLWITYGSAVYGLLRAWWIPYLLVPDPARAARYQTMFGRTHTFLPMRHGISPNTLHVALHLVIVAIVVLLAVITFGR
jgi:hypothetical protein